MISTIWVCHWHVHDCMTLTSMNIKLFCATTESDKLRILKGGFQCIKTMMYAIVFQDLIWSFALGYLKIYRHVLVNDTISDTTNWAERWRITLIIQWISILCLLSMTSVILGWLNMNTESEVNSIHPIKIWQLTVTLMWQPFQSPKTITFNNWEASVSFHNCTIKK